MQHVLQQNVVFLWLYLLKTCHSCVICQDPLRAIQFGWILMIQEWVCQLLTEITHGTNQPRFIVFILGLRHLCQIYCVKNKWGRQN